MRLIFLFFLLIIAGCSTYNNNSSEDLSGISINKFVYDSVQVFVDTNKSSLTEVVLLDFVSNESGTLNYVLTTLATKKDVISHLPCFTFYNRDSSILIIDNHLNGLLENYVYNMIDTNVILSGLSNDTVMIYDPISWLVSIKNDNIIIDRNWGVKQAMDDVIIPKEKFTPPSLN